MFEKHGADKFYKVIAIEACRVPDAEIHKELFTKRAAAPLDEQAHRRRHSFATTPPTVITN